MEKNDQGESGKPQPNNRSPRHRWFYLISFSQKLKKLQGVENEMRVSDYLNNRGFNRFYF